MELTLYVSRCSEVLVLSVTFTLPISTNVICYWTEEQILYRFMIFPPLIFSPLLPQIS